MRLRSGAALGSAALRSNTVMVVLARRSASREQLAVEDLPRVRVALSPPRPLPGLSWRLRQLQLLLRLLGVRLGHSEVVVVEDADRLDHVGHSNPPVADQE